MAHVRYVRTTDPSFPTAYVAIRCVGATITITKISRVDSDDRETLTADNVHLSAVRKGTVSTPLRWGQGHFVGRRRRENVVLAGAARRRRGGMSPSVRGRSAATVADRGSRPSAGVAVMIWAWLFVALLAALAIVQIAVAAGAPLGRFTWGGAHPRAARGFAGCRGGVDPDLCGDGRARTRPGRGRWHSSSPSAERRNRRPRPVRGNAVDAAGAATIHPCPVSATIPAVPVLLRAGAGPAARRSTATTRTIRGGGPGGSGSGCSRRRRHPRLVSL